MRTHTKGFTLIELLVSVAVFLLIATSAYQAYVSLFKVMRASQYKIIALNLASEQFEIIRNLPYSEVGVEASIPNGTIPHEQTIIRGGITFLVTTTIRNVDLVFDGTIGGAPNDLSPADNKSAEVKVECPTCDNFQPIVLTSYVAPKNLETASTNGALFIKVFDANGVAVKDAEVQVVNNAAVPAIVIDDVTDNNGMLQIIDVPPGTEVYEITVSRPGYSTSRTYPTGGAGNPSPAKPHVTVVLQQVTQVSFAIDKLATVSFSSVDSTCTPVPDMNFKLTGSKLIGTGVYKYATSLTTNGSGAYTNSEWNGTATR